MCYYLVLINIVITLHGNKMIIKKHITSVTVERM